MAMLRTKQPRTPTPVAPAPRRPGSAEAAAATSTGWMRAWMGCVSLGRRLVDPGPRTDRGRGDYPRPTGVQPTAAGSPSTWGPLHPSAVCLCPHAVREKEKWKRFPVAAPPARPRKAHANNPILLPTTTTEAEEYAKRGAVVPPCLRPRTACRRYSRSVGRPKCTPAFADNTLSLCLFLRYCILFFRTAFKTSPNSNPPLLYSCTPFSLSLHMLSWEISFSLASFVCFFVFSSFFFSRQRVKLCCKGI